MIYVNKVIPKYLIVLMNCIDKKNTHLIPSLQLVTPTLKKEENTENSQQLCQALTSNQLTALRKSTSKTI